MPELENRIEPEVYFLKFAFPCTEGKLRKNEITQDDFNDLEFAARSGAAFDRMRLESFYPDAIGGLRRVADMIGRSIWDLEVIAEYFFVEHNRAIDAGEGMYEKASQRLRDYCMVRIGRVERVQDGVLVVKLGGQNKGFSTGFTSVDIGNLVAVHQGCVVENLSDPHSFSRHYLERHKKAGEFGLE